MDTRDLLYAVSGACVNKMFTVLGNLWDCHIEYLVSSGHNVYSIV